MGANVWQDRLLDAALSPALWLSVALALAYGTLFTVWRGGGLRRWPRDLVVALAGFAVGQLLGVIFRSRVLRVGDVHLVLGTAGAAVALLLGRRWWRRADER